MPEGEIVACLCDANHQPLWSYCEDDLFCPRCGRPIAGLTCASQLPADDPHAPVWIYPQKKIKYGEARQYGFLLTHFHADPYRRRRERPPVIDFDRTSGPSTPWFKRRLDGAGGACRLVREDEGAADAPEELELPAEGVEAPFELVGDFGRKAIVLKVCNTPQLSIELQTRGIEQVELDADARQRSAIGLWEVMLNDVLEAELTIHALTAPVILAEELAKITADNVVERGQEAGLGPADISAQLLDPIPAGTVIAPKRPWRSKVRLDARRFTEPGRRCLLEIALNTAVIRTPRLKLELVRVEKGRISFWPDPLTVDVMYVGEHRSNAPHKNPEGPEHPQVIRKLYVSNVGDEQIRLRAPFAQTIGANIPGSEITAAWATDLDAASRRAEGGVLALEPGEQGEIEITVDLRRVDGENLPEERTLQARITALDERGAAWSVGFRVAEIQPRTPAPFPLAIDFGNSHSYAALWNPGDPFPLREMIVPAHDLRNPEAFPTAIFFEDLSDRDNPKYKIGLEAALWEQSAPHAYVSDLKRYIGAPEARSYRLVGDASGEKENSPRFHIDELILLYLKQLIQRAEVLLRKHWITRFGVSYPARFNAERRAAFAEIVRKLCERSQSDPELSPLEAVEFDVDEANAVAIGFVFDEQMQREELARLVCPQRPSFVTASFDWGGGSLDTALLRFTVEDGDLGWPLFRSEYLGIGGDERFGGDNMTIAVMEVLCDRLRRRLGPAGAALLDRIPAPDEQTQAPRREALAFRALWTAAEEIKIHQSRRLRDEPSAADQRIQNVLTIHLVHGLAAAHPDAAETIRQGIAAGDFLIDLADVYDHKIRRDMYREGGYTIRQRLAEGADELCRFAERRGEEIDFVVLGGSACRLPLVADLFRDRLPQARIIYDPRRTKFRVAYGLARYLHVLQGDDPHELARSREYTSAEIGLWRHGSGRFLPIIPNCSPINAPELWHPIQINNQPQRITKLIGVNRRLTIYREDHTHAPRVLGWFDLTQAAIPEAAQGALRLLGSESHQELRLTVGEETVGLFPLVPGAPP
jgi:molecular chaperone DnaK (HSP70)